MTIKRLIIVLVALLVSMGPSPAGGQEPADDVASPCKASKRWVGKRIGHKLRHHNVISLQQCHYGPYKEEPGTSYPMRPGVSFVAFRESENRALYRSIKRRGKRDGAAGRGGYWAIDRLDPDIPSDAIVTGAGACFPASGKGWINVDITSRINGVDWNLSPRRMRAAFRAVCDRF